MKHPPLKRHPALQPFSRDHTIGLMRAFDLLRSAQKNRKERQESLERFLSAWTEEIEEHFDDEERLLLALMSAPHRKRLKKEHAEIRSLAGEVGVAAYAGKDPGVKSAYSLGKKLDEHIRWEERELFPCIEKTGSLKELACLAKETAEVERHRPRSKRK